eukprot:334340_1
MSSLLKWAKQNPTKATLLGMIGAITAFKNRYRLRTPKSLRDKVVVITGGACGLGKLLSMKFYKEGSKVLIWDVNKSAIKECNAIQPNNIGGNISAKFVDVTNKSAVDKEAKLILDQYGKVDILVQNAGVVAGRPLFQLSESDVRRTFDVNVISQFWTLAAFLPSMIKNKSGHIVSIVSTAAFVSVSHLLDYAASKAAARSLDQGIKRELMDLGMDDGIVFTGIYPGFMNSGMFEGAKYTNYYGTILFTGEKMLETEYVANKTMDAIKYEKREVVLPPLSEYVVYLTPHFENELQDKMVINSIDMKKFVGGKNRLSKL